MSFSPSITPLATPQTGADHDWPGRERMVMEAGEPGGPAAFRQLRHQTKNALQRILCLVHGAAELAETAAGQALIEDLQQRIRLTAAISDALFGLTVAPAELAVRLRRLAGDMLQQLAAPEQRIALDVRVEGGSGPAWLDDAVLRVAHEMLGEAIMQGLRGRERGTVAVVLSVLADRTRLRVSDDGPARRRQDGDDDGLALMRDLVRAQGGRVWLGRELGLRVATLELPHGQRRGIERLA